MASKYNCKFPIFDTKGNFGGNGTSAAAERYTELMLSDIAIKIFESFSNYVDMKLGELDLDEPVALGALLPLCFLQGTYGIPSGMSTVNIPALNPVDLVNYYIDIIKHRDIKYKSNVLVKPYAGNVIISSTKKEWKDILDKGKGTIKYKPKISIEDNKTIIITGIPENKSFSNVEKILSNEILRDQLDIRNESTVNTRFVVEILPYKKVNTTEIYDRLVRGLTSSESYKFIFTDNDGKAIFTGLNTVVEFGLKYVIECCKRKFEKELSDLEYKLKILTIIEDMKASKDILKLINISNEDAIKYITENYNADRDQAKSVLSKSISYLTREHYDEILNMRKDIENIKNSSGDIFGYLLDIYKSLLSDIKKFVSDRDYTEFA
jgi:DNA gyrase/topoisomerase IV subunit A